MIVIGSDPAAAAFFGRGLPGPAPEETPQIQVLHRAVLLGQSEPYLAIFDTSTKSTGYGLYPDALPGVDVEVAIPYYGVRGSSVPVIRPVTQANVAARNIAPGAVGLANLWHIGSGGEPLRLAGAVKNGTSMLEMMDDDRTRRAFSDEKALIDLAEAAWGSINHALYNWHVSESDVAQTLWENRAPHFFGINPDGTPYDFDAGELEHCLIDTTGRGYGLLGGDAKVSVMYPGSYCSFGMAAQTVPRANYATKPEGGQEHGQTKENAAPAYQARRDFIANAPAENRGVATISTALVSLGDYAGGVQKPDPAENYLHASLQNKYGQILWGQEVAFGLLCSYGYAQATRLARTEVASDGSHVDFIFDLPPAAQLSTQRLSEGLGVAAPRPHQQEVMGFVIWRDGDTERTARPVYRTDNTDDTLYPLAYRGTVAIHDAGSNVAGRREGVVRITPQQAFANGDKVQFGADGSYGAFNLHGPADYDAQLFLDGLRAYEARLDDGTVHAYPGAPVVNQEEMTVSGVSVTAPPAMQPVAKQDGNDAHLSGPLVGPGVTALTYLFKGQIGVQNGRNFRDYIVTGPQGLHLTIESRANQRVVRIGMEDGNGYKLFNNETWWSNKIPAAGIDMEIMVTATQDDGTGNALLAFYLDGVLQDTVRTAPSTGAAQFDAASRFSVLDNDVACVVENVRIWTAYSPDGAAPSSGLVADLRGDPAYWNGAGLPAGWTKQGTGMFTGA